MRVLLVEDDHSLGDTIRTWLDLDGLTVDWVQAGHLAVSAIKSYDYACVLLDRGLPNMSGDEVLKFIRSEKLPIAVLMITAQDSIKDRVEGLDLGADDYLVKPFDLEEMSARIRAAVRKYGDRPSAPILTHQSQSGIISLNPANKQVMLNDKPVTLTHKEYIVLHRLLRSPSMVVSKEQLEDELYGWGEEIESNAIEVYISHLRKKLGATTIKTIRKQGYILGEHHA